MVFQILIIESGRDLFNSLFATTFERYQRIRANLPAFHPEDGHRGWVFVSRILISQFDNPEGVFVF